MRLVRSSAVVAVVAVLGCLGGCAGGGGGNPRSCGGDAACGDLGRCVGGNCVEDVAPVAALSVPASLEAFAVVEFDGSASSDPDAELGDEVAAFHWSFASLDGQCAAPSVTGMSPIARVRFGCAGAFQVRLVVADRKGKESAPGAADVAVAPRTGAPMLVPSADVTVNHVCSGTPRQCTTEGSPPALGVHVADGVAPIGSVAYHWTVDSPDGRPFDEHKHVTFVPSADVADPTVLLEADESGRTALVDDWVFRVTASDGAGPLGEASTRISVANRPPTLAAAVASVTAPHTYSAGQYRASAAASRWTDPDGDPLVLAGSTGSDVCSSATFGADGTATIDCTRAFTTAVALSGFVATHSVSVRASDGWAPASSASTTTVTIQNRPVTAASSTASDPRRCPRVPTGTCCYHDPDCNLCCTDWIKTCPVSTASGNLAISDPDGDPVQVTWTSGQLGTGTSVCTLGSCKGTYSLPEFTGCGFSPGTVSGTFTTTDGLTSAGPATLTVNY